MCNFFFFFFLECVIFIAISLRTHIQDMLAINEKMEQMIWLVL